MKKVLISLGSLSVLVFPLLVFGQNANPTLGAEGGYLGTLISGAGRLLSQILIFLVSLAVVWFIWNVVKYSMSEDDDGKEKARSQMINGVIAIAVIVSVWGLVGILRGAFGVNNNDGAVTETDLYKMIPGVRK